jgi:hypothetical protein
LMRGSFGGGGVSKTASSADATMFVADWAVAARPKRQTPKNVAARIGRTFFFIF